jgi:hypothetical protein
MLHTLAVCEGTRPGCTPGVAIKMLRGHVLSFTMCVYLRSRP